MDVSFKGSRILWFRKGAQSRKQSYRMPNSAISGVVLTYTRDYYLIVFIDRKRCQILEVSGIPSSQAKPNAARFLRLIPAAAWATLLVLHSLWDPEGQERRTAKITNMKIFPNLNRKVKLEIYDDYEWVGINY
ncbi:unnamed protein product [Caretta caretta]